MPHYNARSTKEASTETRFLDGVSLRQVSLASGLPFSAVGLALGQGGSPLEVIVASGAAPPNATTLRSAWKVRNAGRAAPLLLVVLHGERASLCGPAGDDPPAYLALDRGQVERICREALDQPDRHAALRALRDILPSLESELAGLRNQGFLATHELRAGARRRTDWGGAGRQARGVLTKRGDDLLRALGFGIERHDGVTSILRAGDRKVAVAVLLARNESPDLSGERFSGLSPISYALAVADREGLPWVLVQHGAKVRVHPARVGVGVGRRGRTDTYVECHAGLLSDADAAYLWLLCSAEALAPGGSLEQILEASGRFAGDLAERLRERVYESVVPRLAQGIVAARGLRLPTAQDLADTYEMALTVLFRLLFIAYAEDKDLLPYRWNGLYQRRSLKTKAQELAELVPVGQASSLPDRQDAGPTAFDPGGRIGVVLPRSALAAKGSTEFNSRQWFFEDVHPQYTIGLIAVVRREVGRDLIRESPPTPVRLRGPYASHDRYIAGIDRPPAVFYGEEIQEWNDTASLPLLPTDESVEVFAQLRNSPRLDLDDKKSWRARPLQGDLNSTTGKPLMDLKSEERPPGFWPVFKGESFDLWTPDTGTYYAWADPKKLLPHLQDKRLRGGRNRNSPFSEFDPKWLRDPKTLPCLRPRIAFRRISRATDTRTIRVALVPPELVLTDVAPYFLWPRGRASDEAYLLGVMASLILDWYARRFVETHMDFHVLDPLPVPRPPADHPLLRRAIELAGRLACPDDRFAAWAKEVGVACGPLAPDEKEDMIHELDAVVAHLYGLSEKHLAHIFETFHEGWDYEPRLRATLRHFRKLKS